MVDQGDLLSQLRGPDRVVVDRPAQDRLLRVVVLNGYCHAEVSRQISRLPQGGPLGGELGPHAVPSVARPDALAGVADHHLSTDALREPEAGIDRKSTRLNSSHA